MSLVVLAVAVHAAPVGAHTEVQRARPGPGESVAGPVEEVVLRFLDPVLPQVAIEVTDPGGDPVPGQRDATVSDDGREASIAFDPLDAVGDYVVSYEFAAADGDRQQDAYRFSIRAPGARGSSWVGAVLGVAALAVGAGVLAVALRRRHGT